MASKHRVLNPPPWPSRLADPSATDLKTATPPAISSPEYVTKLEAALNPEETAKLKELDPNDTRSEARLLARSSSTPPSPAVLLRDRENSAKHSSSSSDVPQEKVQSSRVQNRICLDPQMHPNQSHSEVHHQGLLPLADFCDFGVEAAPEVHTETPQKTLLDRFWQDLATDDDKDHPQTVQSNPPVHPQGRVFRALTGGDICVEPVDVSGHFHAGHPPILKVRPAPGVSLTPQEPPHHGHRNPVSKLGPFVKDTSQFAPSDERTPDVRHQPSNYWGFSTKHNKPGEVSLDKVEPLSTGIISPPKPTEEYGPPGLGNHSTIRSSGDIPSVSSRDDTKPLPGSEVVQPSRQDDYLHCLSKEHKLEGIHGSIESAQAPKSKDPDPESWIQKRTSRWLRELLHRLDTNSSTLTQLPGKVDGRRNTISSPRDVLSRYQKDPSTSRPLTRHSVDHRYKATFNDLENILDNAVKLAKEAVEHFELGPAKGSARGRGNQSDHQRSGSNASGIIQQREPDHRNGNLMVPIPQRISSLLRLDESLDKQGKRNSLEDPAEKSRHLPTPALEGDIPRECSSPLSVPDHEHCTWHVVPNSRKAPSFMRNPHQPRVQQPRCQVHLAEAGTDADARTVENQSSIPKNHCTDAERWSLDGTPSDVVDFSTQYNLVQAAANKNKTGPSRRPIHRHTTSLGLEDIELQERDIPPPAPRRPGVPNLRGKSHVSLRGVQTFSLARSHPRQPVARDWSDARKRYVASVACISTALIGILVGLYAGLVPSIQYYIVDLNHYAILGNVVFYFGLAIPSFLFWPLPLLHGRKPYILSSLVIAMPLLFPQAISVSQLRSPYISQWR